MPTHNADTEESPADSESEATDPGSQTKKDKAEISKEILLDEYHEENVSDPALDGHTEDREPQNQTIQDESDRVVKQSARRDVFELTDSVVDQRVGTLSENARKALALLRSDIEVRIYRILPDADIQNWSQSTPVDVPQTPAPGDTPPASTPPASTPPASTSFPVLPPL